MFRAQQGYATEGFRRWSLIDPVNGSTDLFLCLHLFRFRSYLPSSSSKLLVGSRTLNSHSLVFASHSRAEVAKTDPRAAALSSDVLEIITFATLPDGCLQRQVVKIFNTRQRPGWTVPWQELAE